MNQQNTFRFVSCFCVVLLTVEKGVPCWAMLRFQSWKIDPNWEKQDPAGSEVLESFAGKRQGHAKTWLCHCVGQGTRIQNWGDRLPNQMQWHPFLLRSYWDWCVCCHWCTSLVYQTRTNGMLFRRWEKAVSLVIRLCPASSTTRSWRRSKIDQIHWLEREGGQTDRKDSHQ